MPRATDRRNFEPVAVFTVATTGLVTLAVMALHPLLSFESIALVLAAYWLAGLADHRTAWAVATAAALASVVHGESLTELATMAGSCVVVLLAIGFMLGSSREWRLEQEDRYITTDAKLVEALHAWRALKATGASQKQLAALTEVVQQRRRALHQASLDLKQIRVHQALTQATLLILDLA